MDAQQSTMTISVNLTLNLHNGKRFLKPGHILPVSPVIGMELWVPLGGGPNYLKSIVQRIIVEEKGPIFLILSSTDEYRGLEENLLNDERWREAD